MTEERKQEILEIIRNTNRRPAQTGKPLYPEEIMAYPNLCEEIESISRTVDGFSYRMDILRAKNRGKLPAVYQYPWRRIYWSAPGKRYLFQCVHGRSDSWNCGRSGLYPF